MKESWQAMEQVVIKAPSLVIGLLLIGTSGAFSFHLMLKLERVGDNSCREGFPNVMWHTRWRSYRRRAAVALDASKG